MFSLFKKKKKKESTPQLLDINNNPLQPGDKVEAMRYELGDCELIKEEDTYYYVSISSDKKVNWLKMIDASTQNQKVRKL